MIAEMTNNDDTIDIEVNDLSNEVKLEAARKRFNALKKKKIKQTLKMVEKTIDKKSGDGADMVDSNSDYTKQIDELSMTIIQQKHTIKKLRDENTDLKLNKMDLDDRIAELEETSAKLKTGDKTLFPSAVLSVGVKSKPDVLPIKENKYALTSQSFDTYVTSGDFRENLMFWKSWQVDMTDWNSSFHGQKVAL